jgi:hypothetical protein
VKHIISNSSNCANNFSFSFCCCCGGGLLSQHTIMQLTWLSSNCRPHGIFIPCSAMALWTIANLIRLIVARSQAVMGRKVALKYYTLYQGEGEPAKAAQLSQHVENLFEAPPLFYVVCIILHQLRGGVTPTTISLAWLYVVCRMVHMHTTTNNVY